MRAAGVAVAGAVTVAGAAGCGHTPGPYTWAHDLPEPPVTAAAQTPIQPRDTLQVHAGNIKEVSGEFMVREDGRYVQPPIGNVEAAGRTPQQLESELKRRLQGVIASTEGLTVSVPKRAPVRVHVVGEVKAPASYDLDRDRTITAALAAAGWLSEFASSDGIFVVRPRATPARVRFRSADLKAADSRSALFQLQDGDVVVVE